AKMKAAAAGVLAIGLASLLIPVERFGDQPDYRITKVQARASADAFLRARGLDPGAFRAVTYPAVHWGGEDGLAGKYFLERAPVARVTCRVTCKVTRTKRATAYRWR